MSTSISPEPTDEEGAAIGAALETVRPRTAARHSDEGSRWRWSGRWWSKPIPLSRDRPW